MKACGFGIVYRLVMLKQQMILVLHFQAVKQQYPCSSYDVAAPINFRFKPSEDGHFDLQNPICIRFERFPTGEWMLAKKNARQVCLAIKIFCTCNIDTCCSLCTCTQLLASDVLDFEKDLEVMTTMHSYNMYPPRFTIEVDGQRATASSLVEVEFTGVNRDLSTEVILPLPIQQLVVFLL